MTLDDLELPLVRIFSEIRLISQFWEAIIISYKNEDRLVLSAT